MIKRKFLSYCFFIKQIIMVALGKDIRIMGKIEREDRRESLKGIYANCDIKKGEVLSEKNMITMRPWRGHRADKWFEIVGRIAKKDYKELDVI